MRSSPLPFRAHVAHVLSAARSAGWLVAAGCGTAASVPSAGAGNDAAALSPPADAATTLGASDVVAETSTAGDDAIAEASFEGDARNPPGWTLVWADEFDGPDGSAVDPNKWAHEVGGGGWGNQEREYYTDGTQNAVVQGGTLVITATAAGAAQNTCWYGACRYTSARLKTQGKLTQTYGRFEARLQIPFGQGVWPAFWMLGDDIAQVHWPACGEIDIMENIGREPSKVHGSLHGQGYPGAGLTGVYTAPTGKVADAFHTFAVEWEPTAIRFLVDDQLYETQTPANVPAGSVWTFDHPFFLLLNLAVGGAWPGDPDATSIFPQTMKVDWVRVFQRATGEK